MSFNFDVRLGVMLLFALASPLCGYAQSSSIADTDLWQLVTSNNVEGVRRVLAGGANPNAKSKDAKDGASPLQAAAGLGYRDVADLLIAKGADVNSRDKYNSTPLHIAAWQGHADVAELLINNHAEIEAKGTDDATPLALAAQRGHPEVVSLLIGHGADVNTRSKHRYDRTPLHEAVLVSTASRAIGELLIAKGADVNAQDSESNTPLGLAAAAGEKDFAELLVAKGAAVDARGMGGFTPLCAAAFRGRTDVAELLIAKGADVNTKTKEGKTPLMIAAENGGLGIVSALLDHGADVKATDSFGNTPLSSALTAIQSAYVLNSQSLWASKVRESFRFTGAMLEQARKETANIEAHGRELAILLINHGADANVQIRKQGAGKANAGDVSTVLITATVIGDAGLTELLIDKGADVNGTNGSNETPLHVAVLQDHRDVAELLLNKGANVNARSDSQRTPLHYLAIDTDDGELATLMIAKGADVNALDKDGRSALAYSNKKTHGAVAAVLRAHGAK